MLRKLLATPGLVAVYLRCRGSPRSSDLYFMKATHCARSLMGNVCGDFFPFLCRDSHLFFKICSGMTFGVRFKHGIAQDKVYLKIRDAFRYAISLTFPAFFLVLACLKVCRLPVVFVRRYLSYCVGTIVLSGGLGSWSRGGRASRKALTRACSG